MRAGRSALAAVVLAAGVARVGRAQRAVRGAGAEAERGRPVMLRLRPRAGDTVRTRFDQSVQLFSRDADGAERRVGMASTMLVLAHSVVEHVDATGAVVVAVTDSVALSASGAPHKATEDARRAMQGRRARLRVTSDGAAAMLGEARRDGRPDSRADGRDSARPEGGGSMKFPPALPDGAVLPGAMWARAMTVPWGGGRGPAGAGSTVDVWFRFDSLARGGTLAFLSLRGTVHGRGRKRHGGPDTGATPGATPPASSVTGALVVDLARGWVVESRTTFQLDGAITAPGAAPRPARVVVTQRLRVL